MGKVTFGKYSKEKRILNKKFRNNFNHSLNFSVYGKETTNTEPREIIYIGTLLTLISDNIRDVTVGYFGEYICEDIG